MSLMLTTLAVMVMTVHGKTFTKCELARELARNGVPRADIDDYVCMAWYESSFRTYAVGRVNDNGSRDHGLFQINDYWNCDPQNGQRTKNGCNHPCSDFKNDDISDDIACVRQLKREHRGFTFSVGWKNNCRNLSSSYLRGCNY
ncbi:lysozyme C, milk isozyme-like [Saccostrea cucullata]|uniref:lysozyme C, milk isozyme-like n=1 Tax=Saccostrea cuccullata TaxID=36930 RepID=UPI002ED6B72A